MSKPQKSTLLIASILAASAFEGCQPQTPPITPTKPTPVPTVTATPAPPSSPSPSPAPMPTSTPPPSDTPAEPTTFAITGVVKTDEGQTVSGLDVQLLSVEDDKLLAHVKTDSTGKYQFVDAPTDRNLQVAVFGGGYGRRVQPIISRGASMEVNFEDIFAVTRRPEIVNVEPSNGATNISPDAPITLTFSMSVDRDSVRDAFALQLDQQTPILMSNGTPLPAGIFPPLTDRIIVDHTYFDLEWVGSSVRFKPRFPLPTVLSGAPPIYRITMNRDGKFLMANGKEALHPQEGDGALAQGPFRLGSRSYPYTKFGVAQAATQTLRVTGVRAYSTGGYGETIRVEFSNPLYYDLATIRQAGGADGTISRAPAAANDITPTQAAQNYEVSVNGAAYEPLTNFAGAGAIYDELDPQHRSVILFAEAGSGLAPAGAKIEVRLLGPVYDAVGNHLSLDGDRNYGRGTSS